MNKYNCTHIKTLDGSYIRIKYILKGTLTNGSPILTHKINDKFLLLSCCSEQFEKVEDTNEYIYYHIVLENNDPEKHYGIWADGVLTESISEKVYLTHL